MIKVDGAQNGSELVVAQDEYPDLGQYSRLVDMLCLDYGKVLHGEYPLEFLPGSVDASFRL
jgi:hypothetical protein